MSQVTTLKEIVHELLQALEHERCHSAAMRLLLMRSSDVRTRATWESDLAKLVSDPELKKVAHDELRPIYDYIREVGDEKAVVELLRKWPTKGKAN